MMTTRCTASLLLVLSIICAHSAVPDTASECGITVVLLGATGDLARRYIWPALYENQVSFLPHHTMEDCLQSRLVIFAASRSEVTDREAALDNMLVNVNNECELCTQTFKDAIVLVKLKSESDYEKLEEQIITTYTTKNTREMGRVVYLAIPPSAYKSTVSLISTYLKPKSQSSSWLRVVLEKPFGRDLTSALTLHDAVSKHLKEDEVYRIDHYLGKWGFRQMTQFLVLNYEQLKPVWNRNGVQLVEIAMEERLDIRGRATFYDANGVLRDVHQNHLTEILTVILMDPSAAFHQVKAAGSSQADDSSAGSSQAEDSSAGSYQAEKLRVLSKLFPPRLHHSVLGQYTDYQRHLEEEGIHELSATPTYASMVLFSKEPKWRGIPFILTSGKQMSERRAFVRVLFRVEAFFEWRGHAAHSCPPEVRFIIQSEGLQPGILVSSHFSANNLQFGPELTEALYTDPDTRCVFRYFSSAGNVSTNSYVSLMEAVLSGRRERFIDSQSLLQSWKIWTPLLEEVWLTKPRPLPYSPDSLEELEFTLHGTNITPKARMRLVDDIQPTPLSIVNEVSAFYNEIIGHKTMATNKYKLSSLLAKELYRLAIESVHAHGSFHIALPGGSSPLLLLDTLSLDYQHSFPWEHTHVWQTDERCVDPRANDSNINQLSDRLFSVVPLPYQNIHPMPIDLQQGLCFHGDSSAGLYKKQLTKQTHDGRLDYVLLGVGRDGHVASLFPDGKTTPTSNELVVLTETQGLITNHRMTLTMKCLLEARKIGLIFTGEGKKDVLKTVQKCMNDKIEIESRNLPVIELIQRAQKEQLSMYVDSELL